MSRDRLHTKAELALATKPSERRPLLLELLAWALTDFDVIAARSYLEELEADDELPKELRARVAMHRGAYEVLGGELRAAERVFRGVIDDPSAPEPIRAEAIRGLGLVRFEQIAPAPRERGANEKAGFWRFIDVLIAAEREDPNALEDLLPPLASADPKATYLATAHALGVNALSPRADEAVRQARAVMHAAVDQGAARLATAFWILGALEGRAGSIERGISALLEGERLLHPDTFQVLSARAERALLLLELGETDAARALALEVLERAEERGAHLRAAVAQAALSEVARREKHRGEAESRATRAIELLRSGRLNGVIRRVAPVLAGAEGLPGNVLESTDRLATLEVEAPADPRLARVIARIRSILSEPGLGPRPDPKRSTRSDARSTSTRAGELDPNALAAHAGMTRAHLTRKLSSELGLTLRELVSRERLSVAVSRLASGDPADRVASDLGFSDARALRRALLRITGRRVRDLRR